ncbi:MAG: alpha/beta fold hydrolase [Hyphomonadaceae bacterium]|nr:alpha/beta fold hydrolase [Hyphomonadaceae bacterium]
MSKTADYIGEAAADTTNALNPLLGGLNRQELLGSVAMMLRRTSVSPMANAKFAGKMAKESYDIVMGKSERAPDRKDKRFRDAAWSNNPFYKRGLQTYLAMQEHLEDWVGDLKLGEMEHARATFVMNMITDAISPTNALVTNPAAKKRAIDSGGLSLVKGLQNAYEDMTKNGGMPSRVDKSPFVIGENVAITPGKVVWKNEMMELIQYTPITDEVREIPFLNIPPQINKFYASDLDPITSVIQFLLRNKFQPFIISWRNPTKEHADWGMSDYVDSLIQCTEVIKEITGSDKINISGACSGGITTATFASLLAAAGDDRINSLTFQVCVLDPEQDDSELSAMASERSLEIARRYSRRKGILKGDDLARMFAWMRPNDLVWNYVVNNYLMGEDPPPYNVLFWNDDSTNLPAGLHSDYLDFGLHKPFTNPGKVEVAGHMADLTKVDVDSFIVAGVTDHITPWKACYRTTKLLGSKNMEFVLSNSGHIQSLLNPPGNPKAKYFANTDLSGTADEWAAGAEEVAGSWWTRWAEWMHERAGEMKPAPEQNGSEQFPPLYDAPGKYVFD